MPKHVDLHVLPRVDDEISCRKTAELLKLAGYSIAALTMPTGLMHDKVDSIHRLFEDESIEVVSRIDLSSNSRAELLRLLRRYRNAYDVVAVRCANQAVASIACRDRRVDIVLFDPANFRVRFNHTLANQLRGALEFNIVSTLVGEARSEVLSRIAKEAAVAKEHDSRVVLSSGCKSPAMVRSPMQLSAIATTIGLSKQQSLQGVSEVPRSILIRNLERRSREYVEEGIKVVVSKAR